MQIIKEKISQEALNKIAVQIFGDMIKAVVDVEKEVVAIDAELHADLEAVLLETGSKQKNLWGINLYPGLPNEEFIEYDSMINIRPSEGNRTRGVDKPEIRQKIDCIVSRWIQR